MSKQNSYIDLSSQRDLINSLIEEKNRLVSEGKYLEANEIKNKINEIRCNSLTNKTLSLSETQEKQIEHLEEAFNNAKPSRELIESCEKAGKLFERKK